MPSYLKQNSAIPISPSRKGDPNVNDDQMKRPPCGGRLFSSQGSWPVPDKDKDIGIVLARRLSQVCVNTAW